MHQRCAFIIGNRVFLCFWFKSNIYLTPSFYTKCCIYWFFDSLKFFVPTVNIIHIYTQRDSSWSSHFLATIYGADNDVTTTDELCPVSIGLRILWLRIALTTTRRAHQNQPQQENLLLDVQRKIFDRLFWDQVMINCIDMSELATFILW